MNGLASSQIAKSISRTKIDLSRALNLAMRRACIKKNKFITRDRILYIPIEVDCNNFDHSALNAVILFHNVFKSDPFSVKRLLVEIDYDSIVLIPLLNNKMISNCAINISSAILADTNYDVNNQRLYFEYELSNNVICDLGLGSWCNDSELYLNFQIIHSALSSIFQLLVQIEEFKDSKIDDYGIGVAQNCIKQYFEYIDNEKMRVLPYLQTIRSLVDDEIYKISTEFFSKNSKLSLDANITNAIEYFNTNRYSIINKLLD